MDALAQLPEEDPDIIPSGNFVVSLQSHTTFYRNLYETIVAQVLGNRVCHCEMINGNSIVFRLPPQEQIHDFVALHVTEGVIKESRVLSVVLKIPSMHPDDGGTYRYLTEVFEYNPPAATQSNYLPKFSQN